MRVCPILFLKKVFLWNTLLNMWCRTHAHLWAVPRVTPENEGFLGMGQIFWLMTSNALPGSPRLKTPRTVHVIPPKKCGRGTCSAPYSNGAPWAINQPGNPHNLRHHHPPYCNLHCCQNIGGKNFYFNGILCQRKIILPSNLSCCQMFEQVYIIY